MDIRSNVNVVVCVLVGVVPMAGAGAGGGSASTAWGERGGPGLFNHPVGVRPSRSIRIPAEFPLGNGGTLTCFTCHQAIPSGDGPSNPRLRGAGQEDGDRIAFCARCHAEGETATAASMHWRAAGSAHVGIGNDSERHASGGGLDAESRRCLTCHDGVSAADSVNSGSTHGSFSFAEAGRNHPIGVAFPASTARGYDVPFRNASLLPREIRLPGGTVGCVSCHNVYNPAPAKLTVPIEGSALCMTCHNLD